MKNRKVSLENVARMLAARWDLVTIESPPRVNIHDNRELLVDLAEAIKAAGGEVPESLVRNLPVTIRVWDVSLAEGAIDTTADWREDYEDAAKDLFACGLADRHEDFVPAQVDWAAHDYVGETLDSGSYRWQKTDDDEPATKE